MTEASSVWAQLQALHESGAEQIDPIGWHYLQVLAERTRTQSGTAQTLLEARLARALQDLRARLAEAPQRSATPATMAAPSPLALLLQDMAPSDHANTARQPQQSPGWRAESPRVQQFRKQLRKISVQKQVSQALAQAPQNAGPINSHMLVLRALGLMRDISPDYLNRFMNYVDTLLCLDEAQRQQQPSKKSATASRTGRKKGAH